MNRFMDRIRAAFDGLNDRERRMLGILAVLFAVIVLGLPVALIMNSTSDLESENEVLRETIAELVERGPVLKQRAQARRNALLRYKNRTPPLGSFLEAEAGKHGLSIQEVTDQPEKSVGSYNRRNVRASINEIDLTAMMNLLSGITKSPYPVAIEQLIVEHYQPGDKYRFKLGVLTFDKKGSSKKSKDEG